MRFLGGLCIGGATAILTGGFGVKYWLAGSLFAVAMDLNFAACKRFGTEAETKAS